MEDCVICSVPATTSSPTPKPPNNSIPEGGPYPSRIKIDTLPGLTTVEPYEYYSGFLNAVHLPDVRVLITSARWLSWKNKPMTIWYNGGPGAPSTMVCFKFGPFLLPKNP